MIEMASESGMLVGTMPRPNKLQIRWTDEIREALEAYAAANGTDVASLVRSAALEKIGRADLIDTIKPGRPWPKKPEASAAKNSVKKPAPRKRKADDT